jgi:SOS-response transcriptional repressor LexA
MSAKARPEWADRLERLRQTLGISQAGLAKRLHVSAMAPSRWERGINEPPAEIYIQLGKMVGEPACWYFWEKAGLKKSDVVAVIAGKKRNHPSRSAQDDADPPAVQIVPSASLKNVRTTTPMCAVPLYRTLPNPAGGSFVDRDHAEVVIAPKDWCKNPDRLFCIRTSGEKMAPCLREGYIIAVDESQNELSKLEGKMVVAQHPQRGLVVHWFQRIGQSDMLVPENREFPPIYLAEGGWTMLGKVVWWIAKAP